MGPIALLMFLKYRFGDLLQIECSITVFHFRELKQVIFTCRTLRHSLRKWSWAKFVLKIVFWALFRTLTKMERYH